MAILRGGKRIGGMDIRIGIPRDKSLDNVAGDPRLKRNQGFGLDLKGNPETTIGRFQSYVNEAEGFARSARYYAEFVLPRGVQNDTLVAEDERMGFASESDLRDADIKNQRRVRAFCQSIQMPDRDIITKELKHNGPARKIAYDFKSQENADNRLAQILSTAIANEGEIAKKEYWDSHVDEFKSIYDTWFGGS